MLNVKLYKLIYIKNTHKQLHLCTMAYLITFYV